MSIALFRDLGLWTRETGPVSDHSISATFRKVKECLFVCEGCMPCECDVGGSDGPDCHQLSGQCTCRPGTTGTHCDQYVYHHCYHQACPTGGLQGTKNLKRTSCYSGRNVTNVVSIKIKRENISDSVGVQLDVFCALALSAASSGNAIHIFHYLPTKSHVIRFYVKRGIF